MMVSWWNKDFYTNGHVFLDKLNLQYLPDLSFDSTLLTIDRRGEEPKRQFRNIIHHTGEIETGKLDAVGRVLDPMEEKADIRIDTFFVGKIYLKKENKGWAKLLEDYMDVCRKLSVEQLDSKVPPLLRNIAWIMLFLEEGRLKVEEKGICTTWSQFTPDKQSRILKALEALGHEKTLSLIRQCNDSALSNSEKDALDRYKYWSFELEYALEQFVFSRKEKIIELFFYHR